MDLASSVRDLWVEIVHGWKPLRSGETDSGYQLVPLRLWCDAKSVIDYVKSITRLPQERRLVADFAVLQDALKREEIQTLCHLRDAQQLADGLTKNKHTSQTRLVDFSRNGRHPVENANLYTEESKSRSEDETKTRSKSRSGRKKKTKTPIQKSNQNVTEKNPTNS